MKIDKLNIALFLTIIISSCYQKHNNTTTPKKGDRIYLVSELTSDQIKSLDKEKTIVLLTGGILEEHGPYLPVFTDGYWNEKFRDTIAKTIASRPDLNVLIFPTIPLGNSGANDVGLKYSFPGTFTVRFETLRSIFMDLATELGEQGFKCIFVIHGHGAPNHQRAIDQAADFFNDTYNGKMVNLFGLNPIMENWFSGKMTEEQKKEDGFSIHAGMKETSSMLYLVPNLVDTNYKQAIPLTGNDMNQLIQIAKEPNWLGYFGSERLANKEFGEEAWKKNVKDYCNIVMNIIDNKIKLDTVPKFGDIIKQSKDDVMLDSLSTVEEQRRKTIQENWLNRKKLN
jgi:creatinine amidohydrolase/Fe(II)-dependent formamide hydrolase-like protein